MSDYAELHQRALKLLERADWDDLVLDRIQIDCIRIRILVDAVSIESVNHASIIYRADMRTGNITNWNAELIPGALEIMRRHMVLDDLADV